MKFYIKQKVFSFKDKFRIMDENQVLQYEVKGKFMSLSNKLELLDKNGNLVYDFSKDNRFSEFYKPLQRQSLH